MRRYHRDIGFPRLKWPEGTFRLSHTDHAKEQARQDYLCLPDKLEFRQELVFEAVVGKDGRLMKLGIRIPRQYRDVCLIVDVSKWCVVTCWANDSDDVHRTLDRSLYNEP